jgi:adenosine deaminase
LARDGVVYAEVRGAPELFTAKGLSMADVVDATIEGYKQGMAEAKVEGHEIHVYSLLCGMRQNKLSQEVAELVVKYRDKGVVGFDIAGPEDGFPPSDLLIICAKRMLTLRFMLVRHMDYLLFGKRFNFVVLSA